jgi:hypothetical protein
MVAKDPSTERRIQELEARVVAAEQELRAVRQVSSTPLTPRERWLAKTTSDSPSNYPPTGNTFECELLSCHFSPTPGATTITEVERGRRVTARTRPAMYLPRGTEVEVWRSRGHGALGVGEWWIGTTIGGGNRVASALANYGTDSAGVQRQQAYPGVYEETLGTPLRINPLSVDERPLPGVADWMWEVPGGLPAAGKPTLIARRTGSYLLAWTMQWSFPSISIGDHKSLYYSGSSIRRVDAFGESGGPPPWLTQGAIAPTSPDHVHRHEMYVPLREEAYVRVDVTSPANLHMPSFSRLPIAANAAGSNAHRYSTFGAQHILDMQAGQELSIDVSAATTATLTYLWPADRYPAMMRGFFLTLLLIA